MYSLKSPPSFHSLTLVLSALGLLFTSACVEGDIAETQYDETPVKMRPPTVKMPGTLITPQVDMSTGGGGEDMKKQMDEDASMTQTDMSVTEPDASTQEDMATTSTDMAVAMPDMAMPDMAMCPTPLACTPGQRRCDSNRKFSQCERDANGCPRWGIVTDCPGTQECTGAGQCMTVTQCIDNDNDNHGVGCSAGPDCDDNDPQRYAGLAEACDGKDNNCDQLIDNGIPGVGQACTSGVGACEVTGSQVCDSSGTLVCGATPGQPTAELCDNIDNNCNGQVDEGTACTTPMCGQDSQEPNNSVTAPFAVTANRHIVGRTCAGDREFFSLPAVVGTTYKMNLAFPHALSNLDLYLYENGVQSTGTTSMSDHEILFTTAQANTTYALEVRNTGMMDTYYILNFTDGVACQADDAFSANQTINDAAPFARNWTAPAWMCENVDDWYYLGEIDAGKSVKVDALFNTTFFGDDDIDVILYGDPDGDNTYSALEIGDDSGDDERFTHVTGHKGFYYLKVVHKYRNNGGSRYRLRVEF